MNILIIHRIPILKVRYDRVIDHIKFKVTYAVSSLDGIGKVQSELDGIGINSASVILLDEISNLPAFDRVIALSEYDLLYAAQLRELYKIPGPKVQDALLTRDKSLMKQAVSLSGIEVPQYLPLSNELSIERLNQIKWLKNPFILKPKDGASSEGVIKFQNLDNFLTEFENINPKDNFQLEEFINSPVVHFDGFVRNAAIQVIQASRYVGSCLDFANGSPFGSTQVKSISKNDQKWAQKVVKGLKIRGGAFHIEAFDTSRGLVFLEAANRCGGADVVPMFERKWGINLYEEHIRFQMGVESANAPKAEPKLSDYCGWFLVPTHFASDERLLDYMQSSVSGSSVRLLEFRRTPSLAVLKTKKVSYRPQDLPFSMTVQHTNSEEIAVTFSKLIECAGDIGRTVSQ